MLDILVALPELKDSIFEKSVILLKKNQKDLSHFGVILNSETTLPCHELFSSLSFPKQEVGYDMVLLGGPVNPDFLWLLHTTEQTSGSSVAFNEKIALTPIEEMKSFFSSNFSPEIICVGTGCAGWAPGQLEEEINQGSWWMGKVPESLVLYGNQDSKWDSTLKHFGIDHKFFFDNFSNNHTIN